MMTLTIWLVLTLVAAAAAYGLARFLKRRRAKRRADAMLASVQALADDVTKHGIFVRRPPPR